MNNPGFGESRQVTFVMKKIKPLHGRTIVENEKRVFILIAQQSWSDWTEDDHYFFSNRKKLPYNWKDGSYERSRLVKKHSAQEVQRFADHSTSYLSNFEVFQL